MRNGRRDWAWLVGLLAGSALVMMLGFGAYRRSQPRVALLECANNLVVLSRMFAGERSLMGNRIPDNIAAEVRAELGRIPRCPLNPGEGYAYRVSADRQNIVFCCFEHRGVQVDDPHLYAGRLVTLGACQGVEYDPPAKRVDARGLQFGPDGRLDLDFTSFSTVTPADPRL